MAIVAHPDDAEFACGGTVAKWTQQGSEVHYLVCTSGNKGSKDPRMTPHRLAEIREREQRAAAKVLGVREVTFLRKNDGELEANLTFRAEIAMLIRHFQPNTVITHDPWRLYQIHPDHRATGLVVIDAIVAARDHLFQPELMAIGLAAHVTSQILLFSTDHPDYFVDVSDTLACKLRALARHKSQVGRISDWKERVRNWASTSGEKGGLALAEAFKRIQLS
ncbi:MAG: PIG-L family deacetylase [candidate division NC10 bacterium]|nr:PIG-L family deacetylase [candidate division NC10 bacterium]